MSLRGKAAVVGVAESDLGEVGPGFTPLDLMGQATVRALDAAGLDKSDVDGLFSASAYHHMPTLSVGEYLSIRPRYSDATSMGGSSFVSHLFHAASAIDAGLCEVALIAYGSTQRSGGGRLVSGGTISPGGQLAVNTNGAVLSSARSGLRPTLVSTAPGGALSARSAFGLACRHATPFGLRFQEVVSEWGGK